MKPPVVVIGRHCKTNQCWIAVRFKKTQSVANISQSHAQERADDAPIRQASSTDGVAEKQILFSSWMHARFSKVLILAPAVVFTLATGESASTRPKKHRRASRPADARALPPPGHAGWEWNPIIMQGLPKRPARTADHPTERAQRPRTIPRGSGKHLPPVSSPSVRFAKAPIRHSGGDRVTNSLHSFALNGGLANNRANGDFYVRSCVNNRPDTPKTLDRQAIFGDPLPSIFASIFAARRHLLATVLGSARLAERGIFRTGEAAMAKVLNEILLFSSMAVFVTGIVLAAARLLI
jgi:hypothetical protein